MIFLRVLPKKFSVAPLLGAQELGGPGSLNRLNPRFLRHCLYIKIVPCKYPYPDPAIIISLLPDRQRTEAHCC